MFSIPGLPGFPGFPQSWQHCSLFLSIFFQPGYEVVESSVISPKLFRPKLFITFICCIESLQVIGFSFRNQGNNYTPRWTQYNQLKPPSGRSSHFLMKYKICEKGVPHPKSTQYPCVLGSHFSAIQRVVPYCP